MRTIGTAVAVYASVLFNGLILLSSGPAAEVLVEAEAFADRGGWVLDLSFPKIPSGGMYQRKGHTSIWVAREEMATQKQMIARGSACSIITAGPVAPNRPFNLMPAITQHASADGAVRRPAEWR
jgi:hypothetical protein